MHRDQLRIEVHTVRRLLDAQFPQWRGLPVVEVQTAGTMNAIFRIGPELAARMPLVAADPEEARLALVAEAEAARELAEVATAPTPEPVAIGEQGEGYPLPWTVHTWLPGHDATLEDPADSVAFAHDLAELIVRLRGVDTRGRRFDGAGRGGRLLDHEAWIQECFARSTHLLDVRRMREIWAELRRLPEVDVDAMCHRDLTPANVLVRDGRLVGLLDTGSFGPADPALDLVAAWHLLDDVPREDFRTALDCGETQWRRGMAWAFEQAMGLAWYYAESNLAMARCGLRTLGRITAATA